MKIFITGDRSVDPLNAITHVLAVTQQIREDGLTENDEAEVYTDSFEFGVARAVRYLFPNAHVMVHSLTDEGHVDLDGLYPLVNDEVDKVYFVHTDAFNSRIGQALMRHVDQEKLSLVV